MAAYRVNDAYYSVSRDDSRLRSYAVIGSFADDEIVVLFVEAVLYDSGRHELEFV